MSQTNPRDLMKQVEGGDVKSLYLLHGDEAFMIGEALAKLQEQIVGEGLADFNLATFYAGDSSVSAIIDTVETLPMMAPRRLVIVKEVQGFHASDMEALLPLVSKPVDTTTVVFIASKIDMRKKFFKQIGANGVVVKFQKPFENQMNSWITYIAKKHGKTVSPQALETLKEWVGTNLSDVNNELSKVSQYIGDRKNIESDDLVAVGSRVRTDTIFELVNCMGNGDCAGSFTHLAHLLESGQNEVGVLSMIVRHFRILMLCQESLKQGLSSGQISKRVGVHSFFIQEYLEQARELTANHLFRVYDVLLDTDRALKSNPLSSHLWLENLVIQSCQ